MSNRTTAETDGQGPTRRLASWTAALRLDDVPDHVVERAKYLILDGLGCALIGAQLPWSRTAAAAVFNFEGIGNHTVIGWGATTSAPGAALLNGTFIQGFELDDFHPFAPLHSASLIVPALLAASELASDIDGATFVRAAVVGFETGPRVGLALHGSEMLTRGWHSGSVFGPIAAAAAVGNLLGLDIDQTEDAIGLGATQASGLMAAQFGAMSKRMHHGLASRNGLYAAMFARAGYTGIKAVFEQPYGGICPPSAKVTTPTPRRCAKSWGSTGRPNESSSSPTPPWAASMPPLTPSSTSWPPATSLPRTSSGSTSTSPNRSSITDGGLRSGR
jgi:aconitate decarboxylase